MSLIFFSITTKWKQAELYLQVLMLGSLWSLDFIIFIMPSVPGVISSPSENAVKKGNPSVHLFCANIQRPDQASSGILDFGVYLVENEGQLTNWSLRPK